MLGCTRMYLAVLGCTRLYLAVLGYTWLFLAVLGCTWLYLAVLGTFRGRPTVNKNTLYFNFLTYMDTKYFKAIQQ